MAVLAGDETIKRTYRAADTAREDPCSAGSASLFLGMGKGGRLIDVRESD